jgi:hypothetical protein
MFKKKVEFKGSAVVGGKDMKKLKKDVAESTGIRCPRRTGRRGRTREHATPPAPARSAPRLDTARRSVLRAARRRSESCFPTRSRSV